MSQPRETQNDIFWSKACDKEVKLFLVLAYFEKKSDFVGNTPCFVERPVNFIEQNWLF